MSLSPISISIKIHHSKEYLVARVGSDKAENEQT